MPRSPTATRRRTPDSLDQVCRLEGIREAIVRAEVDVVVPR